MKIKFTILLTLFITVTILLAGCSGAAAATASVGSGLSTATKLAVGTLKLEGTNQAVTTAQAAQLLTLWEGYQSISTSDTSSQLELGALVKQIQGIMTTDQLQAIETMGLTEQSASEVLQSVGNIVNTSAAVSTPSSSSLSQADQGGGPGGMPGAGGGDSVMSAISGGMSTQSTPAATQEASITQTSLVSPVLIMALIQLLQTRSQTTG